MGAHPSDPSIAGGVALNEIIAADPEANLGPEVARSFGELPFLAKILAAAKPLSVQAHPNLSQAKAGFARENAAGIALDARERTYRDPNHKPELICALTPFDAKCGFRRLSQTRELFADLGGDELSPLREMLGSSGPANEVLATTLTWLLELSAEAAGTLSQAVVAQSVAGSWTGAWFAPDLGWVPEIASEYPGDIGSVVTLLLNHVTLSPGQALFLGAGNLHSYLKGVAVEIMANSDNVVRGGLTPKHIDVPELLAVVDTTPIEVPIQMAGPGSHTFSAPVADFGLTRVVLGDSRWVEPDGPEIVFATEGAPILTVDKTAQEVTLGKGDAVFVPASDGPYRVSGLGVLWRATAGQAETDSTG